MDNISELFAGVNALRKAEAPLDPHTLDVAEQTIRDLIKKTHWASDAARLREAANAVHNLLPERPSS